MSLLLALQGAPGGVSLAVASSSEASSAAAIAERLAVDVGASSEDASAATLSERVAIVVGSQTETASAATLAERMDIAIDSGTETNTSVVLSGPALPAGGTGFVSPNEQRKRVTLGIRSTTETTSDTVMTVMVVGAEGWITDEEAEEALLALMMFSMADA